MDWSKGFTASYRVCMVDPVTWADGDTLKVDGGSINRTDSGLRQSADISCIDYDKGSDKYIRIWMDTEQSGGNSHIALFTGLISTPERQIDGDLEERPLQCYSVLKPAQDVYLPRGWYAASGFIGAEVIDSLLSVCPAPVAIEDGSPRLSQHIVAENGETNLSMIEKVLEAIDWRLRIEGDGTITVCPKAESESAVFSALGNDAIEPEVTVKSDWFDCPNVFRAVSDDASYTVYDDDEDSDLSTVNRGREVWAEETSVKLSDGESLASYTARRLTELQSVAVTASYDRSYHPAALVTDRIRLHYPAQNLSGIFVVTSQKIALDGSGTTTEEVAQV